MTSTKEIRVAIVGVGNCANSLIQGVHYYKDAPIDQEIPGLMNVVVGGYHVKDVKFVAAFDVDSKKVGLDLVDAMWASENNTIKFADVPKEKVNDVIFGYTLANDVTCRELQKKDGQWTRAKGFDTFCPLGPWIETDFVPGTQRITATLNGEIKQDAHLNDMIFKVPEIIHFVSLVMTLLP